MKISINTTYAFVKFNLNYGSVLQNYALQKFLRDRGHEVSVVRDYRVNPINLVRRLSNIRYGKLFFAKIHGQIKEQCFIRQYLNVSNRAYFSYHALEKHCPDADCHIAGSDQIWRNQNKSRFLSYVPDDAVKISYAASFGTPKLSAEMASFAKPLLERFQAIWVRELSGKQIVENLGMSAELLPDPTLLLNASDYPVKDTCQEKHLCYCYFLNLNHQNAVSFTAIKNFTKNKGLKIKITAPSNYALFVDEPLVFPAVEEWLGLYRSAECVFTNTYHGLLFCIIFKKQFLVFLQGGGTKSENERFFSILDLLSLNERIALETDDAEDLQRKMLVPIDYQKVYKQIGQMRLDADEFFKSNGI